MKKITAIISAATIAFPMMMVSPSMAAPLKLSVPAATQSTETSVVDVQYRRHRKHYRPSRKHYRHRSYRRHNNNGDVAAGIIGGLALGAIIGGIANSQSRSSNLPRNYHAEWCMNKYRSYDARSDTFQPYNGPRRRCISPYR